MYTMENYFQWVSDLVHVCLILRVSDSVSVLFFRYLIMWVSGDSVGVRFRECLILWVSDSVSVWSCVSESVSVWSCWCLILCVFYSMSAWSCESDILWVSDLVGVWFCECLILWVSYSVSVSEWGRNSFDTVTFVHKFPPSNSLCNILWHCPFTQVPT